MFQYIIKRILIFIPTFFAISLIIFGLSKMATGDPVLVILKGGAQSGTTGQRSDIIAGEKAYAQKAKELGLDKPTFYFSLTSAAYPRDLYKIQKAHHQELVSRLINQYGNSTAILEYYNHLRQLQYKAADIDSAGYNIKFVLRTNMNDLFLDYEDQSILYKLNEVKDSLAIDTTGMQVLQDDWDKLIASYHNIKENQNSYSLYIPAIRWYGIDNQYQTWMFGDYPWFTSVDSTDYHKIEDISNQIKELRPRETKIARTISTLKGKNYRIKKVLEAENPPADLPTDSLENELNNNLQEIASLKDDKSKISVQIQRLFTRRDNISENLTRYASKGFLRGDFGVSYTDSKKVSTKLSDALYWTVIMNLIAIIIAYLISIPLGVQSAIWKVRNRKVIDNINTSVLFVLYSLPNFWIGTLLLVFFTTSEYAEWMNLFPSSGAQDFAIKDDPDAGIITKLLDVIHHLTLPVFCITYGGLAYLSRQMRGSMLGVIRKDYIRTARAKGLSERKVIWKHAFRNSLFPIITLFGSVFPRALSGAIAIEMIYAIPGMGYLLLMSISSRDWPVVFAIVMLIAVMTMIGNLIADILYAMVDPRVTY